MYFVTDSGTDLSLTREQMSELNIHVVPLTVTLDGKSYREGLDIEPEAFYRLLAASDSLPITSQPSPGDLAELYRQLAADPEIMIMSMHISSGLSGSVNAAQLAADLVPEANITVVDTKTLSVAPVPVRQERASEHRCLGQGAREAWHDGAQLLSR